MTDISVQDSVKFFKKLKQLAQGIEPDAFRQLIEDNLNDMNLTIQERVAVKRVMEAVFAEEKEIKLRQLGEAICYRYFQDVKSKRINQHMVH